MNEVTQIPKHKNVWVALCAAQGQIGRIHKGSINPAFKSRYADLADVISAVTPPLVANGLCLFHTVVDGHMRTTLVHGESETRIDCDVPLIVKKDDAHGYKSATTYAKRIGVESVTGVAPDDDDDGNAAAKAAPKEEPRPDTAIPSAIVYLGEADSLQDLQARWANIPNAMKAAPPVIAAKDARKAALARVPADDLGMDEVPY